jgi:hypothetical protein
MFSVLAAGKGLFTAPNLGSRFTFDVALIIVVVSSKVNVSEANVKILVS